MPRCRPSDEPVFSTSVEVFLCAPTSSGRTARLLHVRGGVSRTVMGANSANEVFSTSVEVFLSRTSVRRATGCLLHVRGGV